MGHKNGFSDLVANEEELRALLGTPQGLAAHKVIHHIDEHCRDFIARSPFMLMATANADGECDVSPRGDAPGFVMVLDEHRLVIPDRNGNRRIDSMRNLLANPGCGLIFLIPGLRETLRINGRACVSRDPNLLQQMAANGVVPQLGIGVVVEECFLQCGKALHRSQLWQAESWLPKEQLPSGARILADHAKAVGMSVDAVEQRLAEGYVKRLY